MTKDNQDDVDKVENALNSLKPGFLKKQCNKTSHRWLNPCPTLR